MPLVWAAFALFYGMDALAEEGAGLVPSDIDVEAKAIENMLMAPCCWTQPVSKHYSGVATEMRKEIRRRLSEGQTREQILAHYVGRYGTRILSMPPRQGFSLMAYILPVLFLAGGGVVLTALLGRRRRTLRVGPQEPRERKPAEEGYSDRLEQELRDRE